MNPTLPSSNSGAEADGQSAASEQVSQFPQTPGVYLMKNAAGQVNRIDGRLSPTAGWREKNVATHGLKGAQMPVLLLPNEILRRAQLVVRLPFQDRQQLGLLIDGRQFVG